MKTHFDKLNIRDYSFARDWDENYKEPRIMRGSYIRNWFSNFERIGAPITYRKHVTDCLELAYVAAKNPDLFVDKRNKNNDLIEMVPFIDLVFEVNNPGKAKKIGRSIELREDWDYMSIACMDQFLRQRWRPGLECTDRLIGMITRYIKTSSIIELNNWNDNRFGVIANKDAWVGRNALGLLLHNIAKEILDTNELSYGAPEEKWISHQTVLIDTLNNLEDGSILWST
jgi:predicted NAD-dependent protein-ADP-ribosyltransferase YbiA (DUF1768 family)